MKKMFWASALTLTFVAGLTACGDSSSSGPDQTQTSGLPATCEAGEQAFAEGVAYTCVDGGWAPAPADNPGTPADNPGVASSTSTTPASTNSNTAKSSSSRANSVNSGTASSSSAAVVEDKCKGKTVDATKEFCDKRDGQVYPFVHITGTGLTQTWMAKNLNYEMATGSYCYEEKAENCEKYGRFYTTTAARSACPEGWRLPSRAEFETLIVYVDESITEYAFENKAGAQLMATDEWKTHNGDEPDKFGFAALPAGYLVDLSDNMDGTDVSWTGLGSFAKFVGHDGKMSMFWSSDKAIAESNVSAFDASSVRCIIDD